MSQTLSLNAALLLQAIAKLATLERAEDAMAELLDKGFIGELGEITPAGQAWLDAQGAVK